MLTAYLGVWEEAGTQGMVGEWAWYGRASTINGGETDRASIVGVQAARWGRGKILSTFFSYLTYLQNSLINVGSHGFINFGH